MKDEEIDWLVYHVITGQEKIAIDELGHVCGLSRDTVEASLWRLEEKLLVDSSDGCVKILSINESLIRCQIKYDTSLPYTIENGVIRPKKRGKN